MKNINETNFLTTDGLTIESATNPFKDSPITKLINIRNKMESNNFADIPENIGNGNYPLGFEETLTSKKSKESKVSKTLKPIQLATCNGILPKQTQIGDCSIETQINGGGNYTKCIFPNGQSSFVKIRNAQESELSKKATIVTGTCLGSINFANAETETGEIIQISNPETKIQSKVNNFTFNENMSIYEMANIIEITNVINSMLQSNSNFDKVVINMPGGSYYLYLLEAFESGFVTVKQALEYFEKVDKKESKLANSITKRIKGNDEIQVDVVSYLDSTIKQEIKQYLQSNKVDNNFPTKLAAQLKSEYFKKIIPKDQSISYQDLIFGDYTSVYLEQLKEGNSVVAVENLAEENLLKKTLLKISDLDLNPGMLTGLYILPKIMPEFDAENKKANNKNNLYFLPQENKISISNIKKILKFYKNSTYVSNNQI